jgi:hypothetical protein
MSGAYGAHVPLFRDIFTEKKLKKVLETVWNVPHVPQGIIKPVSPNLSHR